MQVNQDCFTGKIALFESFKDELYQVVQPAGYDELDRLEHGLFECFRKSAVKLRSLLSLRLNRLKEGEIELPRQFILKDRLIIECEPARVGPADDSEQTGRK